MVRFFTAKDGEVRPIRNSKGYDSAEDDQDGPHRRKISAGQHRMIAREHKAMIKAKRAEARAIQQKAKRDEQAKKAELMYRKWEERENHRRAKVALRAQKRAERESRMLEDEAAKERKAIEREQQRTLFRMIPRGGIRPVAKDVTEEWRLSVPARFRRMNGSRADVVAAQIRDTAPWLGIHNEDDLYQALAKTQRK